MPTPTATTKRPAARKAPVAMSPVSRKTRARAIPAPPARGGEAPRTGRTRSERRSPRWRTTAQSGGASPRAASCRIGSRPKPKCWPGCALVADAARAAVDRRQPFDRRHGGKRCARSLRGCVRAGTRRRAGRAVARSDGRLWRASGACARHALAAPRGCPAEPR